MAEKLIAANIWSATVRGDSLARSSADRDTSRNGLVGRTSKPGLAVLVAALIVLMACQTLPRQLDASTTPAARIQTPAPAPSPAAPGLFGFGHPASSSELEHIATEVKPTGEGLPVGGGAAEQGRPIYLQKCASCHGARGEGTSAAPTLVNGTRFEPGTTPRTIGNYWPYATTVWDYLRRAMPFDRPGSLQVNEVYALTAYLLAENGIIRQSDRLDAESLPRLRMPNHDGFIGSDRGPDVPQSML